MSELVDVRDLALMFSKSRDTIRQWRARFDDFPEPVEGSERYPFYDKEAMTAWYVKQWPERAATWPVTLHRFVVEGSGEHEYNGRPFGPLLEARGYLKAVNDLQYRDWRSWYSQEGLVAERQNDIHVWYLDPSNGEPDEWYVYQARIKGGSHG